jgi:hypothetical protein
MKNFVYIDSRDPFDDYLLDEGNPIHEWDNANEHELEEHEQMLLEQMMAEEDERERERQRQKAEAFYLAMSSPQRTLEDSWVETYSKEFLGRYTLLPAVPEEQESNSIFQRFSRFGDFKISYGFFTFLGFSIILIFGMFFWLFGIYAILRFGMHVPIWLISVIFGMSGISAAIVYFAVVAGDE